MCFCALGLAPVGYGQTDRVSQLIDELKDKDSNVRKNSAWELGGSGDPRAVEPLIAALTDEDTNVRQMAADALGRLKDPRAVEPLIAALTDTDAEVRWRAAHALGRIKDPRVVGALTAALKDTDPGIRGSAAWELGTIQDPRAVEPLIAALKDADPEVRRRAAHALSQIKDSRVVEPLIAALKDTDPNVRENAALELGTIKDPRAVEALAATRDDTATAPAQGQAVQAAPQFAILENLGGMAHRLARLGLPGGPPTILLDEIDDKEPKDFGQKGKNCVRHARGEPKTCSFGEKFKVALSAPDHHTLTVEFLQAGYSNTFSQSQFPVALSFSPESGHTYGIDCNVDHRSGKWIPFIVDVTDKAHPLIVLPPKAAQ